jgi:hypothetical protein
MKINKKSIYAAYGIEYKGGKINTPIGWMNELLKVGNSKTGKSVRTWSMNQTTCCCHCDGCYADSGFYKMANVKKSLDMNTELATKHLDFFRRAILAQLATFPAGTEVRIHAVGDFFSSEYVAVWHEAAETYPGLYFWTYTKTEHDQAFDDLENANIVKSVINGEYNFGHCDHVMKLFAELQEAGESVHICKCGFDPGQHCAGCHKCSSSKYVLFIEHSTDYKAEEDPLYPALAEVVNNQ